ncbi:hypothetical protein NUU61_003549 [Penicillium alfredii]|uniref:SGNH hydrolase-type esterase domain-containing protein n=1 Tax=Penicillium alfredii TaxID=1506179 RepID=A0A9W9KDS6_9EURO|nr:uncharacterized protein NUU61_003549 [Penicillium alfredii]KAJ5101327.1 hypothetical protein NUU61_003549 [Penicillium alfredii]
MALSFKYFISLTLFLGLFLISTAHGNTIPSTGDIDASNSTLDKRDDKVKLRILPLGASITWGLLSETHNGYRKPLRDQLRWKGYEVDMVGTRSNGEMKDKDVEARSGDTIDEVREAAQGSLPYKPNVVLINAGTNDCAQEIDIKNAHTRMHKLINSLVKADGMKDTLIVLSTLIPSHKKQTAEHRPAVNKQYRQLVKSMKNEGINIVLADMDPEAPDPGHGWLKWPKDYTHGDKADSTHPNDYGYSKMAYVWWKALEKALKDDLIKDPQPWDSGSTCADDNGKSKRSIKTFVQKLYSRCKKSDHTGDDGPIKDPKLPEMPQ